MLNLERHADDCSERRPWRPRAFDTIVLGGLAAGTLDILNPILVAYLFRGISPIRVLQSVASGVLGRSAFAGGLATATLGLGLHFFIAFVVAAVYFAAALKIPLLIRRAIPCGLAYGVAVFFFMRHIVLPLSQFTPGAFSLPFFLNGLAIHALGVGLPIALLARRSARRPEG